MPDWSHWFPYLAAPRTEADAAIAAALREVTLPAGETVFRQGDPCRNYLLLVSGQVRVIARAPSGREVQLYRLGPGETCVLTTSCLLGRNRYPAEGRTTTPVTALALPAEAFHRGLDTSAAFRRFVFESYAQRLVSVIAVVEALTSGDLAGRLAGLLVARARDGLVTASHEELATELGTAREVVSRHLRALERAGLIRRQRRRITLLDPAALAERGAPPG